ncbi:glycosyltransferase [Microbacterium alcoholitolerans]|uniref:glycosyltransferase n=1 Tax=unclassified Microbacterium TaxID=2609290 RepID=UPI003D184DDF
MTNTDSSRIRAFGARDLLWKLLAVLPESLQMRLRPSKFGFTPSQIPAPVQAPETGIRLYVGPLNSAGQGWAWARAAERVRGVGAVSMQYRTDHDLGYPTDHHVPRLVVMRSQKWGRRQLDAVAQQFTHVITESQHPLFGLALDNDPVREANQLRKAGVSVASLCHGSDIRLPSRHREYEPDSPFHAVEAELTKRLEEGVRRRAAVLDELDGVEFVSTPDLLRDRPRATWLPVVVDIERWETDQPVLERDRPVVLHAPSDAGLKGTELIRDTLERMHGAGLITLRMPGRLPADRVPAEVARADIVLDQFSLGIYGVAACEAMAAGRVVVSHVSAFVRDRVVEETGLDLPIIEATAAQVEERILEVIADRERFRSIARSGVQFVRRIHDGSQSAAKLAPFLGASGPS